jgi:TPR repeat protein
LKSPIRFLLCLSHAVLALILCWVPLVASASDDPCHIAYLHADKASEARACEAAANAGNADAEFQYGLILWSRVGQPNHDHRAALEWIRKSARQGNYVAQISLGGLLKHKDVEPELRNPVEAYAWLVAAGDEQGAHKLRATFNEADAATADRMASDYKTKYSPLQASPAGRWLRHTDFLSRNWPGLIVLGFFLATRRRLTRKLPFVVNGIVIAYASQYLAGWVLALAMNAVMMRFPDRMLNAAVWTFGLAFVLSLLAPTLGVWALYRFWLHRRWVRASA